MAAKPTGWKRLLAKMAGEVPADELDAYRRAGGPVFELVDQVERRRLECRIDGLDPWTVPPATRAAFLCAWNAFALQTLANDLVDADYALSPQTTGHLPPVTAAQALRFYREVGGWVSRAAQAQANPDYRLDVPVPAPLPGWQKARPVSPAHLHGLLHALRSVHEHADAAMAFLPTTPPEDPARQAQLHRIRQLHAAAQVRARYAEELGTGAAPVHERAADDARAAIEQFYLLGQLVADPALVKDLPAAEPPRTVRPTPPAAPSQPAVPRLVGGWPVGVDASAPAPAPRSASKPDAAPVAKPAPRAPAPPAAPRPAPPAKPSVPRAAPPPPDPVPASGSPGLHLADGWPVPSPPQPAAAGRSKNVAKLETRRDEAKDWTITWPVVAVEFEGTLRHPALFKLRPSLVRNRDGEMLVLWVSARSRGGFTNLPEATLTVQTRVAETDLRPWAHKESHAAPLARRMLYREYTGYPLPRGILTELARAKGLRLRLDTGRDTLEVDAAAVARLQTCCRDFVVALEDPARTASPQVSAPKPRR
jgi:hypothetical protein